MGEILEVVVVGRHEPDDLQNGLTHQEMWGALAIATFVGLNEAHAMNSLWPMVLPLGLLTIFMWAAGLSAKHKREDEEKNSDGPKSGP